MLAMRNLRDRLQVKLRIPARLGFLIRHDTYLYPLTFLLGLKSVQRSVVDCIGASAYVQNSIIYRI